MDDIVRQAMTKWPNVPHCHGWLALDARGIFRMRDEAAQANNQPGDPIRHTGLLEFIHRNYLCDEDGSWYFQNGPQRVYVDLQATPFIARTDPVRGYVLHNGEVLNDISAVFITDEGQLLLHNATHIAMLDDRDIAACLHHVRMQGQPVDDAKLMHWLVTDSPQQAPLHFLVNGQPCPVAWIRRSELAQRFGFQPKPRPKEK